MLAKKERKVLCATLHVDPQNTGAYKLYAGLGFSIDGVLEDYYSPGETSGLTVVPHALCCLKVMNDPILLAGRPAWRMLLNLAGNACET